MTVSKILLTVIFLLILVIIATAGNERNVDDYIVKRIALLERRHLWPAVTNSRGGVKQVLIPYKVKTSSGWFRSGLDKRLVKQAVDEFARITCLRFVPWIGQKDYIEFVESKSGVCESSIGRMGGMQKITLGSGCRDRGRVIHEIMHALGFYHEHNRPDRDLYIRVLWNNIKKGSRKQFEKFRPGQVKTFGEPYDFNSIMHYTNYEFSVNRKPTLQAIKNPNMKVGETEFLSALDIIKVNKLYNCPQAKTLVDSYRVTVVTENTLWSGTDARVFIELYGQDRLGPNNSGELELVRKKDTFEYNRTDRFLVVAPFLGPLTKITVRHDNSGTNAAWHLKKIDVFDVKRKRRYTFNCFCWLQGQDNTKTLLPS